MTHWELWQWGVFLLIVALTFDAAVVVWLTCSTRPRRLSPEIRVVKDNSLSDELLRIERDLPGARSLDRNLRDSEVA